MNFHELPCDHAAICEQFGDQSLDRIPASHRPSSFQAEKRCQYGQQAPTSGSPKDTYIILLYGSKYLKAMDPANPNSLQMDDYTKRHYQVCGDKLVLSWLDQDLAKS